LHPTKIGVTLSLYEWKELKKNIPGVSRIWVSLLHHCIHTYKIICFINT
jgi:hypothetical protein